MESFSIGQWVIVQVGMLEGLVGQIFNHKPNGRVLLVIRTLVPSNGVSVLIDESNVKSIPEPPLERFEIRPALKCRKDSSLT
jgi:hypothetical protein